MSKPLRLDLDSVKDRELNTLWTSVNNISDAKGGEKRFNAFSDRVLGPGNDNLQKGNALLSGARSLMDANPDIVTKVMSSDIGDKITAVKQTLSKFAESSQVIMKGLDAVQQIHPFVGIVVLALKAAIQLELTRRENDQKVLLLKSQMLDMMEVLLDLRNVKDAQMIQPDGTTIQGRLQRIVESAEKDIRDCSATCEKYIHKKFIVKLFDGSRWETRLAAFSSVFGTRKDEFAFALSVHTAHGVDNLQQTMVGVEAHVKSTDEQTSILLLFRELESPKERELIKFIKEKGGPKACSENEKIFKELQAKMKDLKDPNDSSSKGGLKADTASSLMAVVRDEMRTDIDLALSKDRKAFDRKFDAVQQDLREMKHVVLRSTDRVVKAINAGPHDRVVDKDLHVIWKDMAWRGSVKARHFIVAVQDYFIQKYSKDDQDDELALQEAFEGASHPPSPTHSNLSYVTDDMPPPSAMVSRAMQARFALHNVQDRWAIEYITLSRVRSVLEAFDDDASGWISVKEANAFTAGRPDNYSVIKWLAYWAAAFRVSCVRHARRIENFRAQMQVLTADVLPSNRARVDRYLFTYSLNSVDLLLRAVLGNWDESEEDPNLMSYFEDYYTAEETHLRTNLDRFGWNIDASNTLQMITGSGRIERHIFPLLDILLERHTSIIRLACKVPLYDSELWDAELTLDTVMISGVNTRLAALESNYRNQNLNPKEQLTVAYHGMFSLLYEAQTNDTVLSYQYDADYYDFEGEPDESILKYGVEPSGAPDHFYATLDDSDVPPAGVLDGLWVGRYDYADAAQDGLVTTHLELHDGGAISGWGKDTIGEFTVTGTLTLASDASSPSRIVFKEEYKSGEQDAWRYEGELDANNHIQGKYGYWTDDASSFVATGNFSMDRTSLLAARHRPSVEDFEAGRARARWALARDTILERVRRNMWSWSYFRQRRDERREVIDVSKRILSQREPGRYPRQWPADDTDYLQVLTDLERRLVPEDATFYRWLSERELQREPVHLNATCDGCDKAMLGGRHKCLECKTDSDIDGVDLCDDCANKHVSVTSKGLEHHPSHNILKTLRMIHLRDIVRILGLANTSISTGKDILVKADTHLVKMQYASQDTQDDDEVLIPQCYWCEKTISRPCWYCVECERDTFMCPDCEAKQLAMSKGTSQSTTDDTSEASVNESEGEDDAADSANDDDTQSAVESESSSSDDEHSWFHVLVRIQDVPPEPPRVELETRLTMLEQRFAAHETTMREHFDNMESKMADLAEKVTTVLEASRNLSRLEAMLQNFLSNRSDSTN